MDTFIITCEHGGNRIPAPYRRLFREQRALLDSHRGYDPGSLVMAKALATAYRAPLVASTVSRLLIDLNRSIGHPQLFSAVTRAAPAETRAQIVEQYYPGPSRAGRASHRASGVARGSRDPFRRTAFPRNWTVRCAAPTWVCSTAPIGAGRPRCAPAGRKRWRHLLRTFAYAAITPMPAKETG